LQDVPLSRHWTGNFTKGFNRKLTKFVDIPGEDGLGAIARSHMDEQDQ